MSDSNFQLREKMGYYYLNGKDDEDAVYQELMKLL